MLLLLDGLLEAILTQAYLKMELALSWSKLVVEAIPSSNYMHTLHKPKGIFFFFLMGSEDH